MSDIQNCLFCKIAAKEIPVETVYEDSEIIAFKDINPQAPVHLLIIPKLHISTINDISEQDINITGKLVLTAGKLAKQLSIDSDGYRLVFNCNKNAGQTVFHVHMHLLGGRNMNWPPG